MKQDNENNHDELKPRLIHEDEILGYRAIYRPKKIYYISAGKRFCREWGIFWEEAEEPDLLGGVGWSEIKQGIDLTNFDSLEDWKHIQALVGAVVEFLSHR